ncbi:sigma-70 family RNA polymerase sigma factor [Saccharibacillus sp. CPCC 101409]|uniref:RNA polymerase sigma factor n=1 Tax=Saccharibacillus sp. CPCC 101409 TaxID=3058041 RepID=UPI00267239A7|nr:sigma-70 family RNA polymerase sigma factor [Saccharibacillus sp. CPCC 101409]MDO3412271.1 sigma-70 family RNA polymerase sigma factor [Saccharibacillus sp. CPCC 101409]
MAQHLQMLLTHQFDDLDSELQELLYNEYYDLAYGSVFYVVRDHAAAEDVIQEAFLRLIGKRPEFESEAKFFAWLKVVTRNCAINDLRKNKRHRNHVEADSVLNHIEARQESGASPEKAVEVRMMEEAILRHLQSMKPEYRAIILYRWKYGMSYKEIADSLGTSEDIIRQRLFRARENMRKVLRKEWEGSDERRKI